MDNSVSKHECEIEFARWEDISDIIVGVCQEHPRVHRNVFDCMQFYSLYQNRKILHNFQSGSTAEFYIEPIHSCIDDKDMMAFPAYILLFTDDIPDLPDDIRGLGDRIICYQMIPYQDYPGFLKLRRLGNMTYNWNCRKFHCHNASKLQNMSASSNPLRLDGGNPNEEREVLGPAVKTTLVNNDSVPCYWCPQWPKEAKDWPVRRRIHGWPTTDIIHEVVQNGCHVVFAKHPACRDDAEQWRLSFSGAEVCLIQSWTLKQQIVYHLLRFFAKRELIKKNCPKEDEVLATYHFKTLMLWFSEEMSSEFWSSLPVINICCCILRRLSEWLSEGFCRNYFIPQANLFHAGMNQEIIAETIKRLDDFCNFSNLSRWFAVKYITPIYETLFTVEDTTTGVIDAGFCIRRILESMEAGKLKTFDHQFSVGFWECFDCASYKFQSEKPFTFQIFINGLCFSRSHRKETIADFHDQVLFGDHAHRATVEFSSRFPQFGKATFIMFVVNALELKRIAHLSKLFTEFVKDVSWQPKVLRSKHHNFPRPSKRNLERSVVLFLEAQELMENLNGLNSPHEFKLLSLVCKGLLRDVIYCDNLKSREIQSVALGYMAALHFAESDYERATDICLNIFSIQTLSRNDDNDDKGTDMVKEKERKEQETRNVVYVFYFEYVMGIVGFYLLFRRIGSNVPYNRGQYGMATRLSPEVDSHSCIVSSSDQWLEANRLSYNLKAPTFHLSESHSQISIDLCSTIRPINTQVPDDKSNDDELEDEELGENEKKTLKAKWLLRFDSGNDITGINLSSTIFTNQPPTHNVAKETMNAGCLLFIDDIAATIGFCLIFRRIRDDFQYNKRRYFLDFRLTPEVFAQYLLTSAHERKPETFRQKCDLQPPTFPMDKILTAMTNRKYSVFSKLHVTDDDFSVYQRTDSVIESASANNISFPNEYDIVQLLVDYSLESMASFYSDICIDFAIHCNPVDCYRAAYLYKCRKYPEVLELCKQILDEPNQDQNLEKFAFANVMVLPPLYSYFDTDIQCLLGLHTLVCYLLPLNDELCKPEGGNAHAFQEYFADAVYSQKLELSTILQVSYYVKCHYFLRNKFMARYLKVRCLMDCSNSHSEVSSAFKKLICLLPFEHIICCFLKQKLRWQWSL